MISTHELKLYPVLFLDVATGHKKAVLCKNDGSFKVGDGLTVKEVERWSNGYIGETGNEVYAHITHIQTCDDYPDGLEEGYAMLSINVYMTKILDNEMD